MNSPVENDCETISPGAILSRPPEPAESSLDQTNPGLERNLQRQQRNTRETTRQTVQRAVPAGEQTRSVGVSDAGDSSL